MKNHPDLHEADEPKPWEKLGLPITSLYGRHVDELMMVMFGKPPEIGVLVCNGCGRWQEFQPPFRFDAMRQRALKAGWLRDGNNDLCPICVGN